MAEDISELLLVPEVQELPTPLMRKFAVLYAMKGDAQQAAKDAGYSALNLAVRASTLKADERIQKAVKAVAGRLLHPLAPVAISALESLLKDPFHRDHYKAVAATLNRTGFPEVKEVHATVEKVMTPADKLKMLESIAAKLGQPLSMVLERFVGPNRVQEFLADAGAVSTPFAEARQLPDGTWEVGPDEVF